MLLLAFEIGESVYLLETGVALLLHEAHVLDELEKREDPGNVPNLPLYYFHPYQQFFPLIFPVEALNSDGHSNKQYQLRTVILRFRFECSRSYSVLLSIRCDLLLFLFLCKLCH